MHLPLVNMEYLVFVYAHFRSHTRRVCGCMHLLSPCSAVALSWIHLGWAAAWRVSHKFLGDWQDLSSITILSAYTVSIAQFIPKFSEHTSLYYFLRINSASAIGTMTIHQFTKFFWSQIEILKSMWAKLWWNELFVHDIELCLFLLYFQSQKFNGNDSNFHSMQVLEIFKFGVVTKFLSPDFEALAIINPSVLTTLTIHS